MYPKGHFLSAVVESATLLPFLIWTTNSHWDPQWRIFPFFVNNFVQNSKVNDIWNWVWKLWILHNLSLFHLLFTEIFCTEGYSNFCSEPQYRNFCAPQYRKFLWKADETSFRLITELLTHSKNKVKAKENDKHFPEHVGSPTFVWGMLTVFHS